jgi:hypothetical protein
VIYGIPIRLSASKGMNSQNRSTERPSRRPSYNALYPSDGESNALRLPVMWTNTCNNQTHSRFNYFGAFLIRTHRAGSHYQLIDPSQGPLPEFCAFLARARTKVGHLSQTLLACNHLYLLGPDWVSLSYDIACAHILYYLGHKDKIVLKHVTGYAISISMSTLDIVARHWCKV